MGRQLGNLFDTMANAPTAFRTSSVMISKSRMTTRVNKTGTWRFVRPLFDEKTAPCSAACPLGQDIGRVEMLCAQGQHRQAWELIHLENPFPAICGRVCYHACETACNRTALDTAVAIHDIERFLGDQAAQKGWATAAKRRALGLEKIAVVGAGPAGLASAAYLDRLGYASDVFEASTAPGGLLRWGIPAYRLPRVVLDQEISPILTDRVELHCGQRVPPNFAHDAGARYQAVVVTCGHTRPVGLDIPGRELLIDGLDFLRQSRGPTPPQTPKTAAVIGGGNTAVDVARTLIRRGSQPTIVYRRRRSDMPAFGAEVAAALEEGAQLVELAAPVGVTRESGKVALTLQRMRPVAAPIGDRFRVTPDGHRTFQLEVDAAIRAIGAAPDPAWQPTKTHLKSDHFRMVEATPPTILGGDLVNATQSVAHAIASGKAVAMALDSLFRHGFESISQRLAACRVGAGTALSMEMYLGGPRTGRNPKVVAPAQINSDYFSPQPRVPTPITPLEALESSFDETVGTYSVAGAQQEALRCFNCGVCNGCDNCRIFCPEVAVLLDNRRRIDLDYCKGCGICVTECPRNAMALEKEAP